MKNPPKPKLDLHSLICQLTVKMERKQEEARQACNDMFEANGAAGELQCIIWKLGEFK